MAIDMFLQCILYKPLHVTSTLVFVVSMAEKIAKIDASVKDVKARYDGELGELEAALREKEMRVAELDVERAALEKARREYKDAVAAMDARLTQQKQGLLSLATTMRRIEADIARGEKITIARDQDRDALRAIEAQFMDETDAAREVRVRLEEYEVAQRGTHL